MRQVIFRGLAGLLSLAFGAVLLLGDTAKFSFKELLGFVVLGLAFGVYAFIGSEMGAEFLLSLFGHSPETETPPPEEDSESIDDETASGQ